MEASLVTKDGEHIPYYFSGVRLSLDGKDRLVGLGFDVSELKNTEDALVTSEERYRSLVSILTSVVWVADAEGQFVEPQLMFEEFTGQSWEEHKGFGWANAVHPDDRGRISEHWARTVRDKSRYKTEGRMIRANGEYCYFEAAATPLFSEQGKLKEWVGTLTDITERKQAEETLREKQAQLQAILDHSPALISIKDMEGKVTLANRNFELLDIPPLEEFIGKSIFQTFPAEVAEDLWRNDLVAIKAGGPVGSEEVVAHKDGTLHTYLTTKFPLSDDEGETFGICAISADISERVRAEKELERHHERLEELVKVRTRELEEKNKELDRAIKVFVGRELKIRALEKKLEKRTGS